MFRCENLIHMWDHTPTGAQAGDWPFLVPLGEASGARLEQKWQEKRTARVEPSSSSVDKIGAQGGARTRIPAKSEGF